VTIHTDDYPLLGFGVRLDLQVFPRQINYIHEERIDRNRTTGSVAVKRRVEPAYAKSKNSLLWLLC